MTEKLYDLAIKYDIDKSCLKQNVYEFIVDILSFYDTAIFCIYFDNGKLNNKYKMLIHIPELELSIRANVMMYEKALYKALYFLEQKKLI